MIFNPVFHARFFTCFILFDPYNFSYKYSNSCVCYIFPINCARTKFYVIFWPVLDCFILFDPYNSRYRYSSQQSMQLLATMAGCVYKENSDEASTNVSSDLPIQQLHEMLISHSQYLPIMFNESHPEVKGIIEFNQ